MNLRSDSFMDEIFLAGERVPSGLYRELDSRREIRLEKDGYLPATLDGRVATYICVMYTWVPVDRPHASNPA